jgi:hypothetical protein
MRVVIRRRLVATQGIFSVDIVRVTQLRITQNLVGFRNVLEFVGGLVGIVLVGVVFAGEDVVLSFNGAGFGFRINLTK